MTGNLKYFGQVLRSLGWNLPRTRSGVAFGAITCAVLAGTAAVYGSERSHERAVGVRALSARAEHVGELLRGVEGVYEDRIAPMERVLLNYKNDPRMVRRIAVALQREAQRAQVEPQLLLAVLLVENPWLDTGAASSVGAQGLMQVMPFHRGNWKKCAPRLDDIESNICHGAQIFAWNLKESGGDVDRALLRYNGCVRGTNTPNCHQYANHVYARAGRATLMAWKPSANGTMGASK